MQCSIMPMPSYVDYFPMQSLEITVNDSTERDNQAKLIQTYCCTAADLQPWSKDDINGHAVRRETEKREQTVKGEPLMMMIFFLLNLFWEVASLGNHSHLMSILSLECLFGLQPLLIMLIRGLLYCLRAQHSFNTAHELWCCRNAVDTLPADWWEVPFSWQSRSCWEGD